MEVETKTVAEVMVEQLMKIANALEELRKTGLPESLVIMYVQKKTRLPKRDVVAVFEALKDFKKEIKVHRESL